MPEPMPLPLRVGLVGGIFGASDDYRARVRWTPETALLRGLRDRGHDVEPISHDEPLAAERFDVVHVHHLAWGALRAATDPTQPPFAFTLHASEPAHRLAARFVMSRADAVVGLWPDEARLLEERFR